MTHLKCRCRRGWIYSRRRATGRVKVTGSVKVCLWMRAVNSVIAIVVATGFEGDIWLGERPRGEKP